MNRAVELNIKNDDGDSIMSMSKGCDLYCGGLCCMPTMKIHDKAHDKDLGFIKVECAPFGNIPMVGYVNLGI